MKYRYITGNYMNYNNLHIYNYNQNKKKKNKHSFLKKMTKILLRKEYKFNKNQTKISSSSFILNIRL